MERESNKRKQTMKLVRGSGDSKWEKDRKCYKKVETESTRKIEIDLDYYNLII